MYAFLWSEKHVINYNILLLINAEKSVLIENPKGKQCGAHEIEM